MEDCCRLGTLSALPAAQVDDLTEPAEACALMQPAEDQLHLGELEQLEADQLLSGLALRLSAELLHEIDMSLPCCLVEIKWEACRRGVHPCAFPLIHCPDLRGCRDLTGADLRQILFRPVHS